MTAAISFPDLPGWLDAVLSWARPVKFVVLAVVIALAVIGELRKRDGDQ